jgi:Protein of unknown function (DUF1329)
MTKKVTRCWAAHRLIPALVVAVLFFSLGGISRAQTAAKAWTQPEDIPVGTVINMQNWQKYKQYMTVGQQNVFEGLPNIKLPSDYSIQIGPYTNVPVPKAYREDTEKYAGTVTLKALPTGGFLPENYVAGVPFPAAATNPNEPNRGIKLLYNMYYNYKPMLMYKPDVEGYGMDKFGNRARNKLIQIITRMNHISEPGQPHVLPGRLDGIYNVQYNESIQPEEAKYTVVLALFPDDPSKEEQIFLFVPALRRSLRSSAASRCAPFAGGDNYYDDINAGFNGIPTEFTSTLLSPPNAPNAIITMANRALKDTTDDDSTPGLNFAWPKPVYGKWEVRPVYPLELRPIEALLPGYCYPRKVIYVDTQNYQIMGDDRYDKGLKFWKAGFWWFWNTPIPNSPPDHIFNSFLNATVTIVDFQNQHLTLGYFNDTYVNTNVPAKFHNVERYASPAGLDEIMQ